MSTRLVSTGSGYGEQPPVSFSGTAGPGRLARLWDELANDLNREYGRFRSNLAGLSVSIKPDRTLLTGADLAMERLIIKHIRRVDPDPVVVAEEDARDAVRAEVERPGRIWVVDPIDGTAEFVRPGEREFCSVVCLLEDLMPVAAFVFAPELGSGGTPIRVTADAREGVIAVNGQARTRPAPADAGWVSVTRSAATRPRPFEAELRRAGYQLKTATTSQTLDMVGTAVDISDLTAPPLPRFSLFARMRQKAWDGLAGLCLGRIAGLACVDADGRDRLPAGRELLSQPEPVFGSTIVGDAELVSRLLAR